MFRKIYKKLTYSQFLALGFMVVILSGTFLLCLPVSSKTGNWTDPLTALFTATSSTCVTGLAVKDTYLYWSRFGQIVLLFLIQIGGLGFMSIFTIFSVFLKKKISLGERKILVQISGNMRYHGVVSMMKKIIFGTFLI
ncbi:MAG: Trk family potassium uptake protein, partial [Oscillospiraceae bacterium]|nr:Trk family potassium uptake protein [Oscillospiraceae bacterium]